MRTALARTALLASALAGMTAAPAAAPSRGSGPAWQVGRMADGWSCYASMDRSDGTLLMLAANRTHKGVALGSRAFAAEEGGPHPLRWEFGSSRRGVDMVGIRSAGRAGYAALVDPGFVADFARATSVRVVRTDGRPVAALSLRGSAAALRRLAACVGGLGSGPVALPLHDAFRRGALYPRRAVVDLSWVISNDDYPAAAIRAEEEGLVRIRVGIGPDGRVSDCAVIGSSGSRALDAASCRHVRVRGRFAPALDGEGNAVADTVFASILWRIPDEPPPPPPPPAPPPFKLPGG
jgi:TonB family protein